MRPETKIGDWTLISEVDQRLSAPLWIGDNGTTCVYVRRYRVRSLKVTERLQQVAKWAAAFDHNCILPTREVHEVVDGSAVISNYEEGQPLSSVLARARIAQKPVPAPVATAIALDLLDGLHAMGGRLAPAWAHGGLRPEAVLITRGGRARIMEVGITGEMATNEPLASDKSWVAYAAPEQMRSSQLTETTDVFTVATLAWEMLVGKPLFEARDIASLKSLISACDVKRADQAAHTDVPKALAMVIEQALEADPEDRFETTTSFANALRSATDTLGDAGDVSRYLEGVQKVALDTRRRSLGQSLGRAAPTSMPPPAAHRPNANIPQFAAPPRIPSFAMTPRPAQAVPKPFTPSPPRAAARAVPPERDAEKRPSEPVEERLSVPLELTSSKSVSAPAPRMEAPGAEVVGAAPSPNVDAVDDGWGDPDDGANAHVESAPSSEPPSSLGDDIPVDESIAGAPPSLGDDIPVDESIAGAPPSLGDDIPVDESIAGAPPSLGDDIPVDESIAGSAEPPPSTPHPAVTPQAAAPQPAAPQAASSQPGPPLAPFSNLDLDDDADLYRMRAPRRWPWFVVGALVGAGATLGVVYRAPQLLPGAWAGMPSASTMPSAAALPDLPFEPTVAPCASSSSDGASDEEAGEDAGEEEAAPPPRRRARSGAGRPKGSPASAPAPAAPPPAPAAPQPTPAAPKSAPAAPKAAPPSDVYE